MGKSHLRRAELFSGRNKKNNNPEIQLSSYKERNNGEQSHSAEPDLVVHWLWDASTLSLSLYNRIIIGLELVVVSIQVDPLSALSQSDEMKGYLQYPFPDSVISVSLQGARGESTMALPVSHSSNPVIIPTITVKRRNGCMDYTSPHPIIYSHYSSQFLILNIFKWVQRMGES